MKKILVHLHLYYKNQTDFFAEKIKSALNRQDIIYDLFITLNSLDYETERKFLSFKPDTKFIVVENIGADIFPFISVLNLINIKDYDYLIKLHTKMTKTDGNGAHSPNYFTYIEHKFWRNYLTDFLKPDNFEKVLQAFESDEKLGMIANHRVIVKRKKVKYPAGTMFIARAYIFDSVKQLNLDKNKFSMYKDPNAPFSSFDRFLYEMEQFIGNCATQNGLKLEDTFTPKPQIFISKFICFIRHYIKKISRFFFRIDRNGIIKICKIPIKRKWNDN